MPIKRYKLGTKRVVSSKNQVKRKKSPPKKMKPMTVYKTAKGGRIDGIAIRGKTKGTMR